MSENLYVFTAILIAATCVLIFGVRSWVALQGARTGQAREDAYRTLATESAANQSQSASHLAAVHAELARISSRLTAIQETLNSVD